MVELLSFPPVLRGFISLILAGMFFPFTGIFILRLNLINMRFMLMHGVLLAGAVAAAFSLAPLPTAIVVNLLLVLIIAFFTERSAAGIGRLTTFFMVLCVGLAMVLIYKAKIPVQETMNLLWGSIFALTNTEMFFLMGFVILIGGFILIFYRSIGFVLFNYDAAATSGIRASVIFYSIMIITGLTIAFAMRLVGALLLDALVLLPAMMAVAFSKSMKGMFIWASVWGLLFAISGFLLALLIDIPVSSGVIILAGSVYGIAYLGRYIIEKKRT